MKQCSVRHFLEDPKKEHQGEGKLRKIAFFKEFSVALMR